MLWFQISYFSVAMDPFERFQRCLRTMQLLFRLIAQNIFAKNFQYSVLSLFYLLFQIGAIASYIYTIVYFEQGTAFTAVLTMFAILQVGWCSIKFSPKKLQGIFCFRSSASSFSYVAHDYWPKSPISCRRFTKRMQSHRREITICVLNSRNIANWF